MKEGVLDKPLLLIAELKRHGVDHELISQAHWGHGFDYKEDDPTVCAAQCIQTCIDTNLQLGRLTNPNICCVGISVNTSPVPAEQRVQVLETLSAQTGLPCVDPILDGIKVMALS